MSKHSTEVNSKTTLSFDLISQVEIGQDGESDNTIDQAVYLEGENISDMPAADLKEFLLTLICNQ